MIVQLYINNVEIDVVKDIDFPLTYSVSDIKNPNKRKRNSSKTIVLPGTQNNNRFFRSSYDLNATDVRGDSVGFEFDPTVRYPCVVNRNGSEIFRGSAHLQKVVIKEDVNEFHVVLFSQIADLIQALGDVTVAELGWSEYDHILSVSNIEDSWTSSTGSGYVYPLIDFGFTDDLQSYQTNHLFPYIYVLEILNKCFEYGGFTMSSPFFNNPVIRKLIWGYEGGEIFRISATEVADRLVDYDGAGSAFSIGGPLTSTSSVGFSFLALYDYVRTVRFGDNSGFSISENSDNLGQMDESSGEIIVSNPGNYRINVSSNITINYSHGVPSVPGATLVINSTVRVFKNFALIAESSHAIKDTNTGTETFDLNILQEVEADESDLIFVNFSFNTVGTTSIFDLAESVSVGVTFNGTPNLTFESFDSEILDGDTVNLSRFIPKMKAVDFMQDMIKAFNLYIDEPDREGRCLCVPVDDYYFDTDDFDNWSDKMDRRRDREIVPAQNIEGRRYKWKWAEDRDYYKQLYFETYGQGELDYGDKIYDVPSTFKKGEKVYQLKTAQSVPVQIDGTDIIIPRVVKIDESTFISSPHKGKPRMFFYNGLIPTTDTWSLLNSDTLAETVQTSYPQAHHLDNVDSPTFDLNFGVPFWVYYEATSYTTSNLWSNHHAAFIRQITSKDSKILSAYFDLNEEDFYRQFMRRLCNIDGVLYRKNIIKDFRATSNETTKVELLRVVEGRSRRDFQSGVSPGFQPPIDGVQGGGIPDTGQQSGVASNFSPRNSSSSYLISTAGGDITTTLNNSYLKEGKEFTLKNIGGGGEVNITTTSGQQNAQGQATFTPTINGLNQISLPNEGDSVTLKFDGANYDIVSATGSLEQDHHSGYSLIEDGQLITINKNKQMIVADFIDIEQGASLEFGDNASLTVIS